MFLAVGAFAAAIAASHPVVPPAEVATQEPDITREQARERADELFNRFDLNHDGYVSRDEAEFLGRKLLLLRAATGRDGAPGIGGHTLRFLKRRFAGVDSATKEQFEAAFLAHFDDMDSNHDGVLTAAERMQAH